VGTRAAVDFLRAALDALGREGDLIGERLREVEGLLHDALRALGGERQAEAGDPPGERS
jgi:hypothetical protein